MRKLTSFDLFKKNCSDCIADTPFGSRGPNLGAAAGLCKSENSVAVKKILQLNKATIDRAFRTTEKSKDVDVAEKKERLRISKTLLGTSPEEFVEMTISQRIRKELGKGGKGKGKGGKSVELSHYNLADLLDHHQFQSLDDEQKPILISDHVSVKAAKQK